ncbi:MAG: hypothetical protein LUE27_07390 [Clostridia bacterium]|nr:hypothetical protein [Clostridia bacterium]
MKIMFRHILQKFRIKYLYSAPKIINQNFMLKIKLIRKCFQDASGRDDPQVDLLLEENDWNDYYYYATNLHNYIKY